MPKTSAQRTSAQRTKCAEYQPDKERSRQITKLGYKTIADIRDTLKPGDLISLKNPTYLDMEWMVYSEHRLLLLNKLPDDKQQRRWGVVLVSPVWVAFLQYIQVFKDGTDIDGRLKKPGYEKFLENVHLNKVQTIVFQTNRLVKVLSSINTKDFK